MPSPIAHTILGLTVAAVASFAASGKGVPGKWWLVIPLFVFLGNAPDIDFIPGLLLANDLNAYHHVYTHSVGWCLLLATGVWCVWRAVSERADIRLFLLIFGALLLHLLADWVTTDPAPPKGILIAWPLSDSYSHGPIDLFAPMKKDTLWAILSPTNLMPALKEVVLTVPLLLLVLGFRGFRKPSASSRVKGTTR